MYHGSPVRSERDKERMSILRAELEDLDVTGYSTPFKVDHRQTSPTRSVGRARMHPYSAMKARQSVDAHEKAKLVDNYEHVMAENAHVRRQVQYLSKEVASISHPRKVTSPTPSVAASPHATLSPSAHMPRVRTSLSPLRAIRPLSPTAHTDVPLDAILMDEVKQREAEVGQLNRRLDAANRKAVHDYDHVKQATHLLRHALNNKTPGGSAGEYMLVAQSALEVLDDVKGEDAVPGFDDRLRQRMDDHEQAKARILDSRATFDSASLEEKVAHLQDLLTKHELAAVAADGVKKNHTKKVMVLTKQLCEKQADHARTETALDQKVDQLKASHEALAHATAQLAAMTDTTKELAKVQEQCQQQQETLCGFNDEITSRDRKIKSLTQDLTEKEGVADKLRASEVRCAEVSEDFGRASNELRIMQNKLVEADTQIKSLDVGLSAHAEALDTARDQVSELSRNNEMLTAELEKTRQRTLAESNGRAHVTKRTEALEKDLRESEHRVAKLTDQLQASVKETQRLSDSVKVLAAEHDQDGVEIATLRAGTQSARDDATLMKETLRSEQDENAVLKRELDGLRTKHATMMREHEEITHKMLERESLDTIHQEDLLRKDAHADQLLRGLTEREEEVEKKNRQMQVKEIDLRKKLASNAEREEKLHGMEKELIARRQELGHSSVSATITNSKLIELSSLLESKEAELGDLSVANSTMLESLRTLEIDREQEMERTSQLEQVVEMVRGQLQENTVQFGALTEDLQTTRQRLDNELAQHEVLEEQIRSLSEVNASVMVQNKTFEAESTRLSVAVETLELNLQRKNDALIQQKLLFETETAELHRKVAEGRSMGDQARHQEVISQRAEKRAEDSRNEAVAMSAMMKDLQKDLVHKQAQLDDATRNAANLWSAIARLGRKFDDHERTNVLRTNRAIHDKFEDACSFLRYIRGWWSMYKDKDPQPDPSASPPIRRVAVPMTVSAMSPTRLPFGENTAEFDIAAAPLDFGS